MRSPAFSESDALKASQRTLLVSGEYAAFIREALERLDRNDNDMLELLVVVLDADGKERQFRDFLTCYEAGAAKFRHCCASCGPDVLAIYDEGGLITPGLLAGREVTVRIGVQKGTAAYPNSRNVILDYIAADDTASVVNLRAAG